MWDLFHFLKEELFKLGSKWEVTRNFTKIHLTLTKAKETVYQYISEGTQLEVHQNKGLYLIALLKQKFSLPQGKEGHPILLPAQV